MTKKQSFKPAFTIVELLVVIVVIGILAAISFVSYAGINDRAIAARLQADLSNDTKLLELYKVEHDEYPRSLDGNNCPDSPIVDNQYCLKVSEDDDTLTYEGDGGTGGGAGDTYTLTITDDDSDTSFEIVPGGTPIAIEGGGSGGSGAVGTTFVNAWGGAEDDEGNSIVQTADGGYAITGETYSFGNGQYDFDMMIVKFDAAGAVQWDKTWGGADHDIGNSIVQTSDGGYAVTGETSSYGAGNKDMFIVKYDSAGNISWDKTWGGAGYELGASIVQNSDDSYVVVGDTDSFGAGNRDMFIVKFNSFGGVVWDKTWGGAGWDYDASITKASNGGYAVTGKTVTYGAGNGDMFIVKYDSSGNVVWDKTWGGADGDEGHSIIQTSDGGYAITGDTLSSGSGSWDMFIVKYDSSGNVVWDKTWGGAEIDSGYSIVQTSDGGYAVTGDTESYGAGQSDMYIVKYDSSGNVSWNKTWGGAEYEYVYSIVQTNDSGFAITGYTSSFGYAYEDMFIAKYDLNGNIENCPTSMCKVPSADTSSPTASVSAVSASVSTSSASVSTAAANVSNPDAVETSIAPVIPPPAMTETFSSQELYVAWPGNSQTVCKEWTAPSGKTIKGLMVSQETEEGYDYFAVYVDEAEKYNKSGYITDWYVNISATPGYSISVCMSADDSTQDGYGGQVTGVLYD